MLLCKFHRPSVAFSNVTGVVKMAIKHRDVEAVLQAHRV